MSRLIKYRAYLKGFKKMCAVKSIDLEMGTLWVKHGFKDTSPIYDFIGVHAVPLMQYTGINDKNGIEIYEGDILNIDGRCLAVRALESMFVATENTSEDEKWFHSYWQGLQDRAWCSRVIGNIHENPELLES